MNEGEGSSLPCPFCDESKEEEALLKIHCLELHPVEYLLRKDLSDSNLGPSPSSSPVFDKSNNEAKSKGIPGFQNPALDHGYASSAQPPVQPRLSPALEPKPRKLWLPPVHLRRPDSENTSSEELPLSIPLSVTQGPAPRCQHNRTLCIKFPHCLGRLCPLLHPPCPLLPYGKKCLAFNDCAFDHPEYEKTCDACPDRIHPDHPPPVLRHCPHVMRKMCAKFLGGGCENKDCMRAHGLCPNSTCPRDCAYEHMDIVYFCPKCLAIKNIIEL